MNFENIKRLRRAKGWTQPDLAAKSGISVNSISNWENGKAEPTGASLQAIADALGCTTDYLCGIEVPESVKKSTDSDRIYLIEQLMEADPLIIHRMIKYYELLEKQKNEES